MRTKKCETCGNPFQTPHLNPKRGRFCSNRCSFDSRIGTHRVFTEEHRRNLSASKLGKKRPDFMGPNNPRWSGGTPKDKARLTTPEWNILKRLIYEQDNWTCAICGVHCWGKSKQAIQCHHINHQKYDNRPGNLITICLSCHGRVHGKQNAQQYKEQLEAISGCCY